MQTLAVSVTSKHASRLEISFLCFLFFKSMVTVVGEDASSDATKAAEQQVHSYSLLSFASSDSFLLLVEQAAQSHGVARLQRQRRTAGFCSGYSHPWEQSQEAQPGGKEPQDSAGIVFG